MNFLITNRKTYLDKRGRERISNDGDEPALPTFRCGEFIRVSEKKSKKQKTELDYVLYPDDRISSYKNIDSANKDEELVGSARLFKKIYDAMRADEGNPKGDLLVVIHGFNYKFEDSLAHLQKLESVYVEPKESPIGHILYISWPSVGRLLQLSFLDPRAYKDDQADARETGRMLARLFIKGQQFYRDFFSATRRNKQLHPHCGHQIHLAAHSMGNQVLECAMRELGHEKTALFGMFAEALLLHADVDWDVLEPGHNMHYLPTIAERTHVYNSFSDDVLHISQVSKNGERRLGKNGPQDNMKIPSRIVVLDCTNATGQEALAGKPGRYLHGKRIRRLSGGSSTPIKELVLDHWGYLHRVAVIKDIYAVLRGEAAGEIEGRRLKSAPNVFALENNSDD